MLLFHSRNRLKSRPIFTALSMPKTIFLGVLIQLCDLG